MHVIDKLNCLLICDVYSAVTSSTLAVTLHVFSWWRNDYHNIIYDSDNHFSILKTSNLSWIITRALPSRRWFCLTTNIITDEKRQGKNLQTPYSLIFPNTSDVTEASNKRRDIRGIKCSTCDIKSVISQLILK